MRLLWVGLVWLGLVASAEADETRLVPALGAKLTYRLVTTVTKAGDKHVTGQIYTYSITASDGVVAEGSMKLDAMLFPCKDKTGDPLCDRALKAPGARPDGDLTLVPIPDEVSAALKMDTALRLRYFVVEKRALSLPTIGVGDALFGTDNPLRMTNAMDCDRDALREFPPAGAAQRIALVCTMSLTRAGSPALAKPITLTGGAKLDVAAVGMDKIELPSGVWEVRRLKLSLVSSNKEIPNLEGEAWFSEKLGVAVKTRWSQTLPTGASTEAVSELIAAGP